MLNARVKLHKIVHLIAVIYNSKSDGACGLQIFYSES